MTLDLTPFAIAIGGMSAMLMSWLLVQRLWARVFVVGDCDVLQLRAGCDACAHDGNCPRPTQRQAARTSSDEATPTGGSKTTYS